MKPFLIALLSFLSVPVFAQQDLWSNSSFKKFEIGIGFSAARYIDPVIASNPFRYRNIALNGSIDWRPGEHFQIGLSGAKSMWGDDITAFAFNMCFPIGNDKWYIYPGWHIQYFRTAAGEGYIGPGARLGGCYKLAGIFYFNAEVGGTIITEGGSYYLQLGSRLIF